MKTLKNLFLYKNFAINGAGPGVPPSLGGATWWFRAPDSAGLFAGMKLL